MSKAMKEICKHLYYDSCYYRHPKSDFEKAIGKDIDILVKKGYLKDSPKIKNIRDFDEPCYEFSRKFRLIFNYYTSTLWKFIKYYIFFDTIEYLSEKFEYQHNNLLKERRLIMTLEDIKNAGYRVFGAYGVDQRDFSHMHQIYEGYAYHGVIEVDGKKKFFRVTLVEDCPLYNVRIQIKSIDDLKAVIKEYFPVDSSDNHYYDMYNAQICDIYRVKSFVYGIIKDYGFKFNGYPYSPNENEVSFSRQIGDKKKLVLSVDTKNFKLRAYFGVYSWTEADFKMWDAESVKDALSQVMMVPILTEVGPGFDLLVSMPTTSKIAEIKSVDTQIISMFGGKPDDIRTKLETAKENIEKLLATI